MSAYNQFKYLYPPRPDNPILPAMLSFYEKQGWTAQIKKNGACTLWAVAPNKEIIVMNRHNDFHKSWKPIFQNYEPFLTLPKKWYVFAGELLHMKGPSVKDTMYLFDLLVYEDEYLVGKTFKERYDIMLNMFPFVGQTNDSFIVNEKTLVAKNFDIGFELLYNSLTHELDEGLVLKDKNAKLVESYKEGSNNHWLVKCRKVHKNYGF